MIKFITILLMVFGTQICWGSGDYVLNDVCEESSLYTGSTCSPYRDTQNKIQEPDSRCGQKVSIILSEQKDQLAFLESPSSLLDEGVNKTFSLFYSSLLKRNRKCDETLSITEDSNALFNSQLCRAFRSEKLSKGENDVYVFFPNMKPEPIDDIDPSSEAFARAILVGSLTGLPIGVASMDIIALSKSDAQPSQVVVEETQVGRLLFAKAITRRQFIFKR